MKSLRIVLVSAMITFSTAAFAGNTETCGSCTVLSSAESASLLNADSASLNDVGIKGMLLDMTHLVIEKVNSDGANIVLQNMTTVVRKKISSTAGETVF